MRKTVISATTTGVMALGLATAAFAATGEFDNMCAEGLALGKNIQTDCSVNAIVDGKTYCFGNEDAKTIFMKDPKTNLAKAQTFYSSKK
jgi:YHS domain-containing protein